MTDWLIKLYLTLSVYNCNYYTYNTYTTTNSMPIIIAVYLLSNLIITAFNTMFTCFIQLKAVKTN